MWPSCWLTYVFPEVGSSRNGPREVHSVGFYLRFVRVYLCGHGKRSIGSAWLWSVFSFSVRIASAWRMVVLTGRGHQLQWWLLGSLRRGCPGLGCLGASVGKSPRAPISAWLPLPATVEKGSPGQLDLWALPLGSSPAVAAARWLWDACWGTSERQHLESLGSHLFC